MDYLTKLITEQDSTSLHQQLDELSRTKNTSLASLVLSSLVNAYNACNLQDANTWCQALDLLATNNIDVLSAADASDFAHIVTSITKCYDLLNNTHDQAIAYDWLSHLQLFIDTSVQCSELFFLVRSSLLTILANIILSHQHALTTKQLAAHLVNTLLSPAPLTANEPLTELISDYCPAFCFLIATCGDYGFQGILAEIILTLLSSPFTSSADQSKHIDHIVNSLALCSTFVNKFIIFRHHYFESCDHTDVEVPSPPSYGQYTHLDLQHLNPCLILTHSITTYLGAEQHEDIVREHLHYALSQAIQSMQQVNQQCKTFSQHSQADIDLNATTVNCAVNSFLHAYNTNCGNDLVTMYRLKAGQFQRGKLVHLPLLCISKGCNAIHYQVDYHPSQSGNAANPNGFIDLYRNNIDCINQITSPKPHLIIIRCSQPFDLISNTTSKQDEIDYSSVALQLDPEMPSIAKEVILNLKQYYDLFCETFAYYSAPKYAFSHIHGNRDETRRHGSQQGANPQETTAESSQPMDDFTRFNGKKNKFSIASSVGIPQDLQQLDKLISTIQMGSQSTDTADHQTKQALDRYYAGDALIYHAKESNETRANEPSNNQNVDVNQQGSTPSECPPTTQDTPAVKRTPPKTGQRTPRNASTPGVKTPVPSIREIMAEIVPKSVVSKHRKTPELSALKSNHKEQHSQPVLATVVTSSQPPTDMPSATTDETTDNARPPKRKRTAPSRKKLRTDIEPNDPCRKELVYDEDEHPDHSPKRRRSTRRNGQKHHIQDVEASQSVQHEAPEGDLDVFNPIAYNRQHSSVQTEMVPSPPQEPSPAPAKSVKPSIYRRISSPLAKPQDAPQATPPLAQQARIQTLKSPYQRHLEEQNEDIMLENKALTTIQLELVPLLIKKNRFVRQTTEQVDQVFTTTIELFLKVLETTITTPPKAPKRQRNPNNSNKDEDITSLITQLQETLNTILEQMIDHTLQYQEQLLTKFDDVVDMIKNTAKDERDLHSKLLFDIEYRYNELKNQIRTHGHTMKQCFSSDMK